MEKRANNQGKLKGKVKVPANIPAGTKLVQFYGDKGSYGEATYTGKKTITIEERRRVIAARRVDPLAQTFTLNESRHIGGLELWFGVSREGEDVQWESDPPG